MFKNVGPSRAAVGTEQRTVQFSISRQLNNDIRRASQLDRAIEWVRAIESGATGETLSELVTPDVVHEDMPNRFFPSGVRSDLAEMRAGAERGKTLMRHQQYDIISAIASGDSVAMQLDWTAELSIPLGTLKVGGEMKAHVAIFIEFRDGKIWRQRDYGCYEPF